MKQTPVIPPFCLFGNTYFVGTYAASSHLIDTGDGLILLDTGYRETAQVILDGMKTLGFDIRDVKIILHSHGHGDHTDGTQVLLPLCHAKTYLAEEDMRYIQGFVPDVYLKDGMHIRLGNTDILCLHTPGHTNGTYSFFYEAEENGKRLRLGTFGGSGTNQLKKDFLDARGLSYRQRGDFYRSLQRLRGEAVDVFIGNHSWQNQTAENYEKSLTSKDNPFVDATRFGAFLESCEKRMTDVIREESRTKFVNYAHRGASTYAPENTLLSFYTGMFMGANGIETDVQRTKDGVLVLFHDDTIERMTGNAGAVADYTLAELQAMPLTTAGLTDRMVTLETFLSLFAFRPITFAIELKVPGVERDTVDLIRKYGIEDRTVITSFRKDCLKEARAYAPDLRMGYLFHDFTEPVLQAIEDLQPDEVCPEAVSITAENTEQWHRAGYRVRAWGVKTEEDMRRLYDIGVDGMTVNFPDKLTAYIRETAENVKEG